MKKAVVVLFVGVVLFGVCAQRAEAQSASKIIGTWLESGDKDDEWVFNANGTLKMGGREYKYVATDTKLYVTPSIDGYSFFDISISSDGKTLILTFLSNNRTQGTWFTKK